jgi:hypothetical protein
MKSRLSAAVLAAFLVAGCAMPVVPGGTTGTSRPGDKTPLVDPATGKVLPNQPVEPLLGVEFKPLTQGAAQYLSNNGASVLGGGTGNAMAESAPAPTRAAAAPAMPPMATGASGGASMVAADSVATKSAGGSAGGGNPQAAGGAFSGNVWSPYHFGYYFGYGGGADQMALVSVQEGETKGSAGTFQDIVRDVVGPLVKVWAADGRLTSSNAVLTNDGQIFVEPQQAGMAGDAKIMAPMPGYGGGPFDGGNAWRLVYTSTDRSEILSFTVTAAKTTIIRMRWAPLDLQPERVTVDSASAVKKLIEAISDKGFKGEEEKSMKDYFMGYPFEQPQTGQWDGENNKTEVLYQVPKNARWNVNLQQVMGKLVWELNWWANDENMAGPTATMGGVAIARPIPGPSVGSVDDQDELAPCPEPRKVENSYTNWNGQGMVDAETGAVIRFTRPTKNTYWYFDGPSYPCDPEAKPEPKPSATAAPDDQGEEEDEEETDDAEASGTEEGADS